VCVKQKKKSRRQSKIETNPGREGNGARYATVPFIPFYLHHCDHFCVTTAIDQSCQVNYTKSSSDCG